jgi:hypothetical protein
MRLIIAVATLAVVGSRLPLVADQVVVSRDGGCQVSVPADWKVTAMLATAASPDNAVSITVSSPKMIDSFSELKQAAKTAYKQSKATKDTPTEFEMEGSSIAGKPDVYRAIPASSGKYCIAEVIYRSGTIEAARGIVRTLKVAKP